MDTKPAVVTTTQNNEQVNDSLHLQSCQMLGGRRVIYPSKKMSFISTNRLANFVLRAIHSVN